MNTCLYTMTLYLNIAPTVPPTVTTNAPTTAPVTYTVEIIVPTQNAFITANIAYVYVAFT